jgi:hypothetical protein
MKNNNMRWWKNTTETEVYFKYVEEHMNGAQ